MYLSAFSSPVSAAESKPTAADYYSRAEVRYQELDGWKKAKDWANVYDKGPGVKKEISEDLAKAESLAKADGVLLFEIKLLRWKSLIDDDPDRAFGLFDEVVGAAKEAAASKDGLLKVKKAGDELSVLEDKNLSRRLYEIYASSVMKAGLTPDEQLKSADGFLNEGNIYLAKTLYAAYLETLAADKEEEAKKLIEIAGKFASHGDKEGLDPVYAEELYGKASGLSGDAGFDNQAQYDRAFNLERLKEIDAALAQYQKHLELYPSSPLRPEIYFRAGAFEAYAKNDRKSAKDYFAKVTKEFPKDIVALSAYYQLGVLSQWENDLESAKGYYNELITCAEALGLDTVKNKTVLLAKARLDEIAGSSEMSYALRLFLDGTASSVREGAATQLRVDLTGIPAKSRVKDPVRYVATTSNPQTGCMTPVYSYEWSGQVGDIENIPNSSEMTTSYSDQGIDLVGVVVIGPGGPEGAGFDIVKVE